MCYVCWKILLSITKNNESILKTTCMSMDDFRIDSNKKIERRTSKIFTSNRYLLCTMFMVFFKVCSLTFLKCFCLISAGRKLFNESQVDHYLYTTKSKLSIELFIFDSSINIKQYFCYNGKILSSDISNRQENVPISAINCWTYTYWKS